jgi:phosphatidylserine/phosphatidylglycerophosphate/cardiolipin synthase-like enzyme
VSFTYPSFQATRAIPLSDKDYYWFVLDALRMAIRRVWASIFIVNVKRADDPRREVRSLLHELSDARRRGIDVRVLVGDAADNLSLHETNLVARTFMRTLHIPTTRPRMPDRSGSHDKYVIIDDELLILGSHNWTDTAFNRSTEDSLAVYSRDLVRMQETEFLSQWPAPEPEPATPRRMRLGSASPLGA